MNELDKLNSLVWWQNYRGAAEQKLKTAKWDERYALLAIVSHCDYVIGRMAPIVAAESRATLARLDAEDAAGTVAS